MPTPSPDDWAPARITEEGIDFMRAHLGIRRPVRAWNSEISRDSIWHFAQGVGDDNPLWWDEAYARRSVWGRMFAPPAYLYSCLSGGKMPDDRVPSGADGFLPGTAAMQTADRWRWLRPLYAGEKISTFQELHAVEVLPAEKFGAPAVNQIERTSIIADNGDLVAELYNTRLRL